MWARKRVDIRFRDLIRGIGYCFRSHSIDIDLTDIANRFNSNRNLTCLSVRSGFDLLLQTLRWPPGSEIVFSGITIPDMVRISREHQLKVVGIDLDGRTLAPVLKDVESKITPQTKAIVVAHLMGGRCEMRRLACLAKKHNLMLIEDCAQAFLGPRFCGSAYADVSMFSFGAIKTNTALGGGILFVRDSLILEQMKTRHGLLPVQKNRVFLKRIFKYGAVKLISTWPCASLIRIGCRYFGSDHDRIAAGMAKGFAGRDFWKRIRQQPSAAMVHLLANRIRQFDGRKIEERKRRGDRLTRTIQRINPQIEPIGFDALTSTHWVYAILVHNPRLLAKQLWDHGFDATTRSSLALVQSTRGSSSLPQAKQILDHLVFLPIDAPMPIREIERMGTIVARLASPVPYASHRWPNPLDSEANYPAAQVPPG